MNKKTEHLHIRITPEDKKKLKYLCKELDRSQGWVITQLIAREHAKISKGK